MSWNLILIRLRDEFGFQKPQKTDELIFYCRYASRTTFLGRCQETPRSHYITSILKRLIASLVKAHSIRSGARAGRAATFFAAHGYTNLKTYPGSILDWLSP